MEQIGEKETGMLWVKDKRDYGYMIISIGIEIQEII